MKSNYVFFATVFLGCLLFAVGYPDGYPSGPGQLDLARSYGPPALDRVIQPQYHTPSRLIQYAYKAPAPVIEPTYYAPSRIIQSPHTAPFTSTSPVIQSVYGPPAYTHRVRRSTFDAPLSSEVIGSLYGAPSADRLKLTPTHGAPALLRVSAPTYGSPSAGRLELTPMYGPPAPPRVLDSTYRAPFRVIQSTYGAPQPQNIMKVHSERIARPQITCDESAGYREFLG